MVVLTLIIDLFFPSKKSAALNSKPSRSGFSSSLFPRFCLQADLGAMGSSSNGVMGDRSSGSNGGLQVDKGVDFAQYFCTYAFLYHQKEMLCDRVRMDAYFNAIFKNKHHFEGKVRLFSFLFLLLGQ